MPVLMSHIFIVLSREPLMRNGPDLWPFCTVFPAPSLMLWCEASGAQAMVSTTCSCSLSSSLQSLVATTQMRIVYNKSKDGSKYILTPLTGSDKIEYHTYQIRKYLVTINISSIDYLGENHKKNKIKNFLINRLLTQFSVLFWTTTPSQVEKF